MDSVAVETIKKNISRNDIAEGRVVANQGDAWYI
jgi:hypothetical protein